MQIYIVEAEHFQVPGLVRRAFFKRSDADKEARALVTSIAADHVRIHGWPRKRLPTLEQLQDWHGAASVDVQVVEVEVK